MSVKCILQGQTPEATSSVTSITSGVNMLRNWYFPDPVNQRGLTEYSGVRYVMDGWHTTQVDGAYTALVQLNDEFVTFTSNTSGARVYLLQNLELSLLHQLAGKQVTISCLARIPEGSVVDFYNVFYADGKLNAVLDMSPLSLADGEWHCFSLAGVAPEKIAEATSGEVTFRVKSGSIDIKAVKLELGATQTLAHQDENGEWVLNDPPPDKNLELLKCCMSTADSSDTYANNKVTPAAVGAVNKAGDTMNGNLVMKNVTVNDGVNNQTVLTAYDDGDSVNYGCELVITGNGNTFVGGGESAKSLRNLLVGGGTTVTNEAYGQSAERLYLSADNEIYLETNCNTVANRKCVKIDKTGRIYAPGGFEGGMLDWEKVASVSFNATSNNEVYTGTDVTLLAANKCNFFNVTDILFVLTSGNFYIYSSSQSWSDTTAYSRIYDPIGQSYIGLIRAKKDDTTYTLSNVNQILSHYIVSANSDHSYITCYIGNGVSAQLNLNTDGTNANALKPSITVSGYNYSQYSGAKASGTLTMYVKRVTL